MHRNISRAYIHLRPEQTARSQFLLNLQVISIDSDSIAVLEKTKEDFMEISSKLTKGCMRGCCEAICSSQHQSHCVLCRAIMIREMQRKKAR